MSHRLDPLLRPESIAVFGATERADSVGRQTVENLLCGEFPGPLYAINPNYETVCGIPCYPDLTSLPAKAEHVIFAISDARIEAALDDVIAHGAKAVTIMSALLLEEDSEPNLLHRVHDRIRESGLLVCGGNGMGFYNFRDRVWACGFDTRNNHQSGNVALISHSGSGMSGIVDVDERIDFNLAVSAGQELSVTMADYLDFALEMPDTRVVGLFMEMAREPERLMAAFEKANRKRIPIVALKVGRTELAARLAVSHSGAIAGNDAAYQALFDRYGVQRVDDMDELATTLIMFAQPHSVAAGGLVAIHDSGGERQLLIDRAGDFDVPLVEVSAATVKRLEELLDPGLPPVNPLDGWGKGGPDADKIMADCFAALMADEGTAAGVVLHDRAPHGEIYTEYLDYLRAGHASSGKPVFLVSNRQGTGADAAVISATRAGFPVLDGIAAFLRGAKCLFDYRDFSTRDTSAHSQEIPDLSAWQHRLSDEGTLGEYDSMCLLGDMGLPVVPSRLAADEATALTAARDTGFPVVLKTAADKTAHKTEHQGVCLDLRDTDDFVAAYREMSARLGEQVSVSPMITASGVEMMIGMVRDEQFGPLIVFGFGGTNAEILGDCGFALAPVDANTVHRQLGGLKLRPLLDGYRGAQSVAVNEFCELVSRFSHAVVALGDTVTEIDINPVIVSSEGCFIVDALVAGKTSTPPETHQELSA